MYTYIHIYIYTYIYIYVFTYYRTYIWCMLMRTCGRRVHLLDGEPPVLIRALRRPYTCACHLRDLRASVAPLNIGP